MKRLALIILAVFMAAFSIQANALGKGDFDAYTDLVNGSKHGVGMGNGGTPLTTRPPAGYAAGTRFGNMAFAHTPNSGAPFAQGDFDMPNATGKPLPASAKQPLNKAAMGKAMAGVAKNVFFPLAVGSALWELWKVFDVDIVAQPDGTKKFYQSVVGTGTGYAYRVAINGSALNCTANPQYCDGYGPPVAECQAAVAAVAGSSATNYAVYGSVTYYTAGDVNSGMKCNGTFNAKSNGAFVSNFAVAMDRTTCAATPSACVGYGNTFELTEQQMADMIALQSGWPTGSPVDRAIVQTLELGGQITLDEPVTYAAPSPSKVEAAPKVTTTSDGSTQTDKTSCDWIQPFAANYVEYQCGVVTTTVTPTRSSTETITTTKPDGTTTTEVVTKTVPSTTKTSTTTGVQTEDLCLLHPDIIACQKAPTAAVDSDLPAQPVLYTPKYAQGLQGVWNTEVALIKATPLFALPAQLAPNLGDSHACPSWNFSMDVGLVNWGTHDVSPPCFVWSFLRICIIVGALFLARALVFGG